VSGILSQPSDESVGSSRLVWKPVAFYSRKLIPAERNYITGDQEMLAIVASFKEWRHYLEMPTFTVRVISDHFNLQSFMITKTLNKRQARWTIKLAAFDFVIIHRRGKDNPADRPSRRPDYATVDPDDEENPLQELIRTRMKQGDPSDANHIRDGDSYSVGVLTRGAARAGLTPSGSQWRTYPLPTAEGTRDAGEMPAKTVQRDVIPLRGPGSSDEPSPFGKIPDALTSHLLHL
jgi:RNase H-like domain found in reverse transcriptase